MRVWYLNFYTVRGSIWKCKRVANTLLSKLGLVLKWCYDWLTVTTLLVSSLMIQDLFYILTYLFVPLVLILISLKNTHLYTRQAFKMFCKTFGNISFWTLDNEKLGTYACLFGVEKNCKISLLLTSINLKWAFVYSTYFLIAV